MGAKQGKSVEGSDRFSSGEREKEKKHGCAEKGNRNRGEKMPHFAFLFASFDKHFTPCDPSSLRISFFTERYVFKRHRVVSFKCFTG